MGGDHALRSEPDRAAGGTVRLLTLNLGLLCLELRGHWRIPLASQVEQRLAAAPRLLSSVGADILALQEVYSPAHRQVLIQALAARYPFKAEPPRTRSLVGNGLLVLSRFPILHSAFTPCCGASFWTRLLWSQGFLAVEIDLPVVGLTRLINVHIAASMPFGDPKTPASEANRKREIGQLLSAASASNQAAILVGDFNTSPDIYPRIITASSKADTPMPSSWRTGLRRPSAPSPGTPPIRSIPWIAFATPQANGSTMCLCSRPVRNRSYQSRHKSCFKTGALK